MDLVCLHLNFDLRIEICKPSLTSDKVGVYKMDSQNENDSDKREPNNTYIIRETCLFARPSQTSYMVEVT